MNRGFLRAGHLPTLVAAFLYFDVSFMVWVILGPLAVFVAKDLHLSPAQKGLMVATPVLAGAALRIASGVLADALKPRLAGILMQTGVIAGLAAFWTLGVDSFGTTLALGIVLGVAGASFAIALPLASYWYPPEHQGTALGIAGAGNSGTVLAALFAPSLAVLLGWRNVLGLAIIPLAIVLGLFVGYGAGLAIFACLALLALTALTGVGVRWRRTWLDRSALSPANALWLMAFYCVSFGGFVGLSSFLPIYFNDQYGLSPVNAGYCTAAAVFAGSFARPFGGAVADRIGGVKALSFATGGVGGFYLAASLGYAKQLTGADQAGDDADVAKEALRDDLKHRAVPRAERAHRYDD
jgi:NNP family nitrate/nitrite transporter-like MFS transporter